MPNRREDSSKVCGLCLHLVDVSVLLPPALRSFMIRYLRVQNHELPAKICKGCYQHASSSKKFHEICLRSMAKLRQTPLSESMLLGKSAQDMTTIRRFASNISPAILKRKDSGACTEKDMLPGRVIIAGMEKDLAEVANEHDGEINYRDRRMLLMPTNSGKPGPASKTQPGAMHHVLPGVEEVTEVDLENESLASLKKKKQQQQKKPQKRGYYYLDDGDDVVDLISDHEGVVNNEEIFPSIGPYQCEICQVISHTKQEFVTHIKTFHMDVVDEEILDSLEKDLRKASRFKKMKRMKKRSKEARMRSKGSSGSLKLPPAYAKKMSKQDKVKLAKMQLINSKKKPGSRKTNTEIKRQISKESERARKKKEERARQRAKRAAQRRRLGSEADDADYPVPKKIKLLDEGDAELEDVEKRTCQLCKRVLKYSKDLGRHKSTKSCRMAAMGLLENGKSADSEKDKKVESIGIDSNDEMNPKEGQNESKTEGDDENKNPEFWKARVVQKYEQENESENKESEKAQDNNEKIPENNEEKAPENNEKSSDNTEANSASIDSQETPTVQEPVENVSGASATNEANQIPEDNAVRDFNNDQSVAPPQNIIEDNQVTEKYNVEKDFGVSVSNPYDPVSQQQVTTENLEKTVPDLSQDPNSEALTASDVDLFAEAFKTHSEPADSNYAKTFEEAFENVRNDK